MHLIVKLQADIMQLDVTWLYDDFVGNMSLPSLANNGSSNQETDMGTTSEAMSSVFAIQSSPEVVLEQNKEVMSWEKLKTHKLAEFVENVL